MKFSSQEEYGLRCLIHIAKQGNATIPGISRAEGITEPYVAKLLGILRRDGFIKSTRGQAGGYTLSGAPGEIIIGNVLNSLGGKLYEENFCEKHAGATGVCSHSTGCSIKPLWDTVQKAVDEVVNNVTLAQMIETSNVQLFSAPPERQKVNA